MNLGAARVVADFETPGSETENIIAFNNAIPAFNNAVFAKSIQLGCVNGPTDFTDAGVRVENIGTLNAFAINADGQTRFQKTSQVYYHQLLLNYLLINS